MRHGLRVHGRLDGRRRRREGDPCRRARPGRAGPADRRQRVRWRPDAGGHARADAAGQDAGGARATARGRRPVHLDPLRPDHRRRVRLVRRGRRREHRRARRAHRVRRRPRHRRARSRPSCRPGSSARSSCSATVSSTGSCARAELHDELASLLRLLPARGTVERARTDRGRARVPAVLVPDHARRSRRRARQRRRRRR